MLFTLSFTFSLPSISRIRPARAPFVQILVIGTLIACIASAATSARADFAQISALVSQVSQTELEAHVAALAFDRSSASGQAAAQAYITAELESFGYTVSVQPVAGSANIIAVLQGTTDPGDVFVLGAHFDTVPGSPGADDDASGVATVLETARVLAATSLDRTLHLVLFALEEAGYQGSAAYAASLASQGVNVTGMISLDMVGYTCSTPGCQILLPSIPGCLDSNITSTVGDFIGLGANTASTGMRDDFYTNTALYQPALPVEDFVVQGNGSCFSQTRRSDHANFWDEGYPAIILGDGAESRNPNYHASSDVPATLDPVFMTSVARAVVAHVASSRMAAPTVVPVLAPGGTLLLGLGLVLPGFVRLRRAARSDRA